MAASAWLRALLPLAAFGATGALGLRREHNSAAPPPAEGCACLNWKEVYASGAKLCDEKEGAEGFDMWKELCGGFYKKLDTNRCTTVGFDFSLANAKGGGWCYVNASCGDLHGGEALNANVSAKLCQRHTDNSLQDLPPRALYEMAQAMNLDLGLLAKKAYQLYPIQWDERALDPLPTDLEPFIRFRVPIVLDTQEDHHGDKIILVGQEVWRVKYEREVMDKWLNNHWSDVKREMGIPWELAPQATWFTLHCEEGCNQ